MAVADHEYRPLSMKKLFALVLLVVAGTAVGLWFIQGWNGPGPSARPTPVVIASGTSLGEAAGQLEKAGVIASAPPFFFKPRSFGAREPIKAGEYEFPAHASHSEILAL